MLIGFFIGIVLLITLVIFAINPITRAVNNGIAKHNLAVEKRKLKEEEAERKNKAQRIMIESGWYEKWYYIIKVIRSCEKTTTNSLCVIRAKKWGMYILRREYDVILKSPKAQKVKQELDNLFFVYTETLYDIYEQTWEKAIHNIIEQNKKTDENSIL